MFSLASLIVFTLAVGFVQPNTPYCVVLVPGVYRDFLVYFFYDSRLLSLEANSSCQMVLVPAGRVVRGGALGMLKEAVVGRTRRRAENREFCLDQSANFD